MESLIYYAVALSGAAALTKKLFDIIDILEGGAKRGAKK